VIVFQELLRSGNIQDKSLETYYISKAMTKSTGRVAVKSGIDWRAVGRRIRELRGFDMTQAEFATRIGISQGHLSSLERGEKEAGATVLLAISQEFGKSVDWLLTGHIPG
jgi:DNA-binding XRE family transcriptional regulator